MIVTSSSNSPQTDPHNKKGDNSDIDVLELVYIYLQDAVVQQTHHAQIAAKQLQQNALTQERLNDKAGALPWYEVPAEDITHKPIYQTYYTYWTDNDGFRYRNTHRKQIGMSSTVKNAADVEEAQISNQQVSIQRQALSDKLIVLQQIAQVGETKINSDCDVAAQTMQQQSELLEVLKMLTFKAMMRQPVQG